MIIRSGNHMLYQTSGELLSYSAKEISRNLQSVQGMANFILEDSTMRSALSESKDQKENKIPSDAYNRIH